MKERFCKKGYKMLDMNSVEARGVLVERNTPYLCLYVDGYGYRTLFQCIEKDAPNLLPKTGKALSGFRTSITDIGCLGEAVTAFPGKVRTGLVAGRTGSTFHITEDNLTTYIRFSAMIAVDAEVMGIIESAFMIPVT